LGHLNQNLVDDRNNQHRTTAYGPNSATKTLYSTREILFIQGNFINNEKVTYLWKACWFVRM